MTATLITWRHTSQKERTFDSLSEAIECAVDELDHDISVPDKIMDGDTVIWARAGWLADYQRLRELAGTASA